MESPQPWLWLWLLGAPVVFAIIDWLRTPKARTRNYGVDERQAPAAVRR